MSNTLSPSTPPAAVAKPFHHPALWVPSLYLAMGVPNAAVGVVSKIMYKNLGITNEDIVLYTSMMYLPWVLKPLWAPFMEPYFSKRKWVMGMQFLMAVMLGLVAFVLPLPDFFRLSLALFWIIGFASGTQDIAADAVYLTTLPPREQAKYTGIQGICWNCGSILASGPLVMMTGVMHESYGYDWAQAWMVVMGLLGLTMALLGLWHLRHLPEGEPSAIHGGGMAGAWIALKESWVSFFQKKHIGMMLLVVFMYRFGEGFIENFGQLFLMDPREAGGLGFDNYAIGKIYNFYGTVGFLAGALLGGLYCAKFTLRRSFFILALALNVPNITYYYLSAAMPENMALVAAIVTIEKFGFGIGSVGHMLYMMQQIAPGPFQMTHYAFATGVMALTKMVTGPLSRELYLLCDRNYPAFFAFVVVASIPPLVVAWFAPFPQTGHDRPKDGGPSGA